MDWDFDTEMRDYEGELRRLRRASGFHKVVIAVSALVLVAAIGLSVIVI